MITIDFKIISKKNMSVFVEGYVEINDIVEYDDATWFYWNGNQYQYAPFYHHGNEDITGLTEEQNQEIDEFKNDYLEDALFIDTTILQANEDENKTIERENLILIINKGSE